VLTKEGGLPGIQYPLFPGHEVAGTIDELGAGVSEWKQGTACRCRLARRPGRHVSIVPTRRFSQLPETWKIPGISYDGGYQEYMVAPVEALAAIPDTLSAVEAAPLLCAGHHYIQLFAA